MVLQKYPKVGLHKKVLDKRQIPLMKCRNQACLTCGYEFGSMNSITPKKDIEVFPIEPDFMDFTELC